MSEEEIAREAAEQIETNFKRWGIVGLKNELTRGVILIALRASQKSSGSKWKILDSDCDKNFYDIDTGRERLRMVTDDYQMACDLCNAAQRTITRKDLR